MRQLISALLLLFCLSFLAQNRSDYIEEPNSVEQKHGLFYKDSWKPFDGNTIFQSQDPNLIYKGKVKNGIEYYAEVYDENENLVDILENGTSVEFDSKTFKTKFKENEKFTDVSELKIQSVKLHYNEDFETGRKAELNGIVKFENEKYFYSNGALTKIETYYDEDCKMIRDSYEIFSTELGNLFDADLSSTYHGNYKLWNKNGKIIESGKYEMGTKTK